MKAKVPDLENYIGRSVQIPGTPQPIVIGHICGNMPNPKNLQINHQYTISMLRFFAQMNGARDITEDQFRAFEEMEMHAEPTNKDNLDFNAKEEFKK